MTYDVAIVGGGPAGLSAALALGRARRRVLLCDAGPRRNAAAEHIHGFVTRDGTPPTEFRRIGRQQLEPYPSVDVRDVGVEEIQGERGAFTVRLASGNAQARRILLCTGMLDEVPDIEGLRPRWGSSIFICPYCHGWEVQDRRFGVLVPTVEMLDFALLLRAWTRHVLVLTQGAFAVPDEARARMSRGGIRIDERRIQRLAGGGGQLERVDFVDGAPESIDVLFARPPQRHVAIVQSLGLTLDPMGYVQVDANRETSRPGIYAGGDLVTPQQAAVLAAASGMQAAAMLNHALMADLATSGALP